MSKTKKYLIGLLPALVVAGVVYAAPLNSFTDILKRLGLIENQLEVLKNQQASEVKLSGVQRLNYCGGGDSVGNGLATSTAAGIYIAADGPDGMATSTRPACTIIGARRLALNLISSATTSVTGATLVAPVVNFTVEYSDNLNSWYSRDFSAVSSGGVNSLLLGNASSSVYRWPVASLGTTTKQILLTDVAGKYIRLSFKAVTATTSIFYYITNPEEVN